MSLIRSPNKASEDVQNSSELGILGQLHPALVKASGLDGYVFIAEIPFKLLSERKLPAFLPVSAFPASRRDLSLLVPESVSAETLISVSKQASPDFLERSYIFDVYQGKSVESGQKSIGLGLIFQEKTRTLTDEEIESATQNIVANLSQKLNAVLREG